MFNSKSEKKLYDFVGTLLCCLAGGGVGLVVFGSQFILPGLLVGAVVGHTLAKLSNNKVLKKAKR